MFKIIIPILVIALAAFVGMNAKSGLIRGVADGMLVSPARPAVAVKPAADFASVDARRVDLSPSVQNSMLQATSVQAVYALYNHEGPQAAPAHLAALLAVSQNDETWPVEPELGFPAIRHKKQDIDGFSGFADTYVLDAKDDPWASDDPALWENGSLVRRFTFILWFYKAKLIGLSPDSMVFELIGKPDKIDAFLKMFADYKILEQCRTGVTALERGGMHQHMQKPPQEVRAVQLPLPGTHCPERT